MCATNNLYTSFHFQFSPLFQQVHIRLDFVDILLVGLVHYFQYGLQHIVGDALQCALDSIESHSSCQIYGFVLESHYTIK